MNLRLFLLPKNVIPSLSRDLFASSILFPLAFLLICNSAIAQLEWKSREQKFKPSVTDTNCAAQFEFKNPTDHLIKITSVQTSCGCTTTSLEKNDYKPGENGKITANFIFGDRQGDQQKTIIVNTSDSKESTVLLQMYVAIPEVAKLSPSVLFWSVGETNAPKSLLVHSLQKLPIKIQSQSNQQFDVNLKTLKEAEEYELILTPKDTKQTAATYIMLATQHPSGITREIKAYALVRPSAPNP